MKRALLLGAATALYLVAGSAIFAQTPQSPDPSKWKCRNLADTEGRTFQDETVFGAQACRPITQAVQQAPPATVPPTAGSLNSPQPTLASAQQPAPAPQSEPAQQAASTVPASAQNKPQPRVFLQAASHGNTWNAHRDQSMEMSKDFEKACTDVKVTINQQAADYTVILNHIEVGLLSRDNQIQVADKNGDLLKTKEGGSIKGSVKKACDLILADWNKQ
jgi:hypothetical protein